MNSNSRDEYQYSDAQIVTIIRDDVQTSDNEYTSRISNQRQKAHKAYNGELPEVGTTNRSSYVSRDVFEVVETIKSRMKRVFTATSNVVLFEQTSEDDKQETDLANAYVNKCFYTKNEGDNILIDTLHDALLTKQCVVKTYWDEATEYEQESVENLTAEQMDLLLSRPDVEIDGEIQMGMAQIPSPITGYPITLQLFSADLLVAKDSSQTRVEVVPPEDMYFDGTASEDFRLRSWVQRYEKTRSELVEDGFDRDVVDKLSYTGDWWSDGDRIARDSYDQTWKSRHREGEKERQLVTVWEAYKYIDMDDDGIAELWQFIIGGDKLLRKERVSRHPFRWWSPIRVAHKIIGLSEADVTLDLQGANSNTVRGMIDNVFQSNTGRIAADLQKVRNPRELIDNPIGGVIDSPRPNEIFPVPHATLSPHTGALIEVLAQQKEARTGSSRLAAGLNGDAVSNQNADDMIQRLTNASNERIMEMARSYAHFLKDIMTDIWEIGKEKQYGIDIDYQGQSGKFNPTQMQHRNELTVTTALTPEDRAAKAQALMVMDARMSQDQALAPLYSVKEKYGLYSSVFELLGFNAHKQYLASPTDPEAQQRMQQMQQQAQVAAQQANAQTQAQLALLKQGADAQTMRAIADAQRKSAQTGIDIQKNNLDEEQIDQDHTLDVRKQNWNEQIDLAEIALESEQDRPVTIN